MSLVLYVLILIECDMIHSYQRFDSLEFDASKQLSEFLKNRFRSKTPGHEAINAPRTLIKMLISEMH
jgi:hypothetical protein